VEEDIEGSEKGGVVRPQGGSQNVRETKIQDVRVKGAERWRENTGSLQYSAQETAAPTLGAHACAGSRRQMSRGLRRAS
jgi:hypothetical protein